MDFQWDDCMLAGLPTEQLSSTLMDIHMKVGSDFEKKKKKKKKKKKLS